jgi:hypothetical protein
MPKENVPTSDDEVHDNSYGSETMAKNNKEEHGDDGKSLETR